jgi:GMP reductase
MQGWTSGPGVFRIPVVPANMKTVVSESICIWMAQNNYFYVMHRFDLDNVAFVQEMKQRGLYASISLGVKNLTMKR